MFKFSSKWLAAAPGKLAGVALAEELVHNVTNFLLRAALPFITFLCGPKQHILLIFEQRQVLIIDMICKWWSFDTFLMVFQEPEKPEGRWRQQTSENYGIVMIIQIFADHLHVGGW